MISIRSGRISSTSSPNAGNLPLPTARLGTAIPTLSTCRCAPCLSAAYNDARRKLVGDRASLELCPGRPDGRVPRMLVGGREAAISGAGIGEPTIGGIGEPTMTRQGVVAGDTCHVDVVDRWGNMVSATPSGGWLQSSPVIPELGFCLGTRMQMFWLEEGLPASLMPGKRPRSTLSPSMAFKDGAPALAFGTPGGDQQDQWSALMFVHHVDHRMNLQEAIDCPAFHTEHMPELVLPARCEAGSLGARRTLSRRDARLPRPARPSPDSRRAVVGGPAVRLRPRRNPRRASAQGRCQSARHAGLCGRALIGKARFWQALGGNEYGQIRGLHA